VGAAAVEAVDRAAAREMAEEVRAAAANRAIAEAAVRQDDPAECSRSVAAARLRLAVKDQPVIVVRAARAVAAADRNSGAHPMQARDTRKQTEAAIAARVDDLAAAGPTRIIARAEITPRTTRAPGNRIPVTRFNTAEGMAVTATMADMAATIILAATITSTIDRRITRIGTTAIGMDIGDGRGATIPWAGIGAAAPAGVGDLPRELRRLESRSVRPGAGAMLLASAISISASSFCSQPTRMTRCWMVIRQS